VIREFEFYHGAVLGRLIRGSEGLSLEQYPGFGRNAAYVINKRVGLYIKHSTNRLTPWSFTFKQEHQDEIHEMRSVLEQVFVALVCWEDGVVCLSYDELKVILDENHNTSEWIRVARRTREKYTVSGSDGKLRYKIGENEFPEKILEHLVRASDLTLLA